MQSWNYIRHFEGNREADVAPGENEFDTPGLDSTFSTLEMKTKSACFCLEEAAKLCSKSWFCLC